VDEVRHLSVFDTTLRDGEQAPGNTMSFEQKFEMFRVLDDLGLDLIEAGFPSATPYDFELTKELAKIARHSKICAFVRANRADIDTSLRALQEADQFQIQTLAVGSKIHLDFKRKITAEAAIAEAVDAVSYLRAQGVQDISLGVEDATRGDFEYLQRLINAGVEAGATTIVLADTVGCALPHEFGGLVRRAKGWIGDSVKLAIHCHDDLGLALANALAGIEAGADEVQSTLCGVGERAGNTSFEELAAVLHYKRDQYRADISADRSKIYAACTKLIEMLGLPVARHKSIIGQYVFATEAGIHQHGMMNNPITYEYVEPHQFGRERQMLIGRHSGRSVMRQRLLQQGIEADEHLLEQLYQLVMNADDLERYNDSGVLSELYSDLVRGTSA
jgi:2-isopropylmalate synthase